MRLDPADRDRLRALFPAGVATRRALLDLGLSSSAASARPPTSPRSWRRSSARTRHWLGRFSPRSRTVCGRSPRGWAQRLLRRSPLPAPRWNVAVRRLDGTLIGVADAWWDVGLVWEIDSREWHLGPEEHDRDTRRQSGFAAAGIPVGHTRPRRLRDESPVLDELSRAHAAAALAPRPAVVTEFWRP